MTRGAGGGAAGATTTGGWVGWTGTGETMVGGRGGSSTGSVGKIAIDFAVGGCRNGADSAAEAVTARIARADAILDNNRKLINCDNAVMPERIRAA